jgi:hypothetical protein
MIDALPWADEVTSSSSLVDYASNLADFSAPGDSPEPSLMDNGKIVGAIANGVLGYAVLPDLIRSHPNAPVSMDTALMLAVFSAVLGYYFPLPTTCFNSALLVKQL